MWLRKAEALAVHWQWWIDLVMGLLDPAAIPSSKLDNGTSRPDRNRFILYCASSLINFSFDKGLHPSYTVGLYTSLYIPQLMTQSSVKIGRMGHSASLAGPVLAPRMPQLSQDAPRKKKHFRWPCSSCLCKCKDDFLYKHGVGRRDQIATADCTLQTH